MGQRGKKYFFAFLCVSEHFKSIETHFFLYFFFNFFISYLILFLLTAQIINCASKPGDVCYEWAHEERLEISVTTHNTSVNCYDVKWSTLQCPEQVLIDCYSLDGVSNFNKLAFD